MNPEQCIVSQLFSMKLVKYEMHWPQQFIVQILVVRMIKSFLVVCDGGATDDR